MLVLTTRNDMSLLSTPLVARAVGIHRNTLVNWFTKGAPKPGPLLQTPKPTLRGAVGLRLWSAADVERVRVYKAKYFRKGRGRKKLKKGEPR
jgi:hypothetical protein